MALNRVLLPAPLGPIMPRIFLGWAWSEIPRRTFKGPKDTWISVTLNISAPLRFNEQAGGPVEHAKHQRQANQYEAQCTKLRTVQADTDIVQEPRSFQEGDQQESAQNDADIAAAAADNDGNPDVESHVRRELFW